MTDDITLGDIYHDLSALIERGAHPGSIDWVLHHKVNWPDGEDGKRDDCLYNHPGYGAARALPPVVRLPSIHRADPEPLRWKLALLIALAVVVYTVGLVIIVSRAGG